MSAYLCEVRLGCGCLEPSRQVRHSLPGCRVQHLLHRLTVASHSQHPVTCRSVKINAAVTFVHVSWSHPDVTTIRVWFAADT